MKTTIDLSDDLLLRSRKLARREGATLRALVEEGLRRVIEARAGKPAPVSFELPSFGGEGPLAGRTDAMHDTSWSQLRDEIYGSRR